MANPRMSIGQRRLVRAFVVSGVVVTGCGLSAHVVGAQAGASAASEGQSPGGSGAGLLVALAIGIAIFLLLTKLRLRAPPAPQCAACDIEMEPAGDTLDPNDPMVRYPVGQSDPTLFGHARLRLYMCPRCGKRAHTRS